jgi:hypothetical protein
MFWDRPRNNDDDILVIAPKYGVDVFWRRTVKEGGICGMWYVYILFMYIP